MPRDSERRWDEFISEAQAAAIEWLVDPERVGSQKELAARIGVDQTTLSKWKKDYLFRKAWDRRLADLNVSPDRIQRVIDSIFSSATSGDMKAADLYLRYVDRFTPKVAVVNESRDIKEMSDEELALELENGLKLVRGEG